MPNREFFRLPSPSFWRYNISESYLYQVRKVSLLVSSRYPIRHHVKRATGTLYTPSKEQQDALLQACDSNDTEHLRHLVENFRAKPQDLSYAIWAAINHDHPRMVRYLLDLKVDTVDGYMVESALKVSAIQVLDVLRDFGWNDINDIMRDIG